ncbi:MAG: YlxM family DNA-binding protein [Clostridia bacterium]|nr:YlxM family DNA-binding protein [Clostridia bacterium]
MEKQTAMEKKVQLSWYLAFYGEMLTENQREIANMYFEEDYSLAEIAQHLSVSRQSIHDTVTRVEKTLTDFENKLGLAARFERLENGLRECAEALKKVIPDEKSASHLQKARDIISALLAQEDM